LAQRLPEFAAMPLAVEVALLHNFVWHERFTWNDRRFVGLRQRAARLFRFHAGNGVFSISANTLLTWGFVEWLRLPAVPSAVAAIALCAPANFLLADCWVFAGAKMKLCLRR
jgi:putative flippase GtrA